MSSTKDRSDFKDRADFKNRADFKDRIGQLPAEKRALLERALLNKLSAARPAKPILRRATDGPCPLSFQQQTLWFLDQWEPGTFTYNAALCMTLMGPLNVEAMCKTFDSIVERHEILRTTYHLAEGHPVQVVQPVRSAGTKFVDARRLPEEKRRPAVDRLIREETRRPFHLEKHLTMRTTIVRIAEDEHVLLLVAHHIGCDGWTRDLLFREISAWYQFHVTGVAPALQPLSIQYADYAMWQRESLQGAALEKQTAYWRGHLGGCPEHIDLPLDHPRPAQQVYCGAHYFFELPAETAEVFHALTRKEGATVFIANLAAFNVLLYALSGQDDILIGTPMANRARLETEPLMGFFANTVVVRLRLDGDPDFHTVLARAKETALETYSHQDMPFDKVVEAMRLPRDMSRNPLFQVNFRVRTASESTLVLPGLGIHHTDLDLGTSKFDMAVELCADNQRVSGFVEYNTALFESATIERIAAEYIALIGELAAHPGTPVTELKSFQSVRQFASAKNESQKKQPAKNQEPALRTFVRARRPVDLAGREGAGNRTL